MNTMIPCRTSLPTSPAASLILPQQCERARGAVTMVASLPVQKVRAVWHKAHDGPRGRGLQEARAVGN